jgi:hypothetical protein
MPVIPTSQETEIRKIVVQGHSKKKLVKYPSQEIESGVLVYTCDPSHARGIGRRITVGGQP